MTEGRILQQLFADPRIETAEMSLAAPIPLPHPAEARQVVRAAKRRQAEFAAGRACARQALARLGVTEFVLLNGSDRAPIWPHGIVGSITHTGVVPDGFCGVAVARDAEIGAVGLDAEENLPLDRELWSFVLTENEQARLSVLPASEQGLQAKIIFSAKECVYKALYPSTRYVLGFHDVEVTLVPDCSQFEAQIAKGVGANPAASIPYVGRILCTKRLLLTALVLAPVFPRHRIV